MRLHARFSALFLVSLFCICGLVSTASAAPPSFSSTCPATSPVWVADFDQPLTYIVGNTYSSPLTENHHKFVNANDFEIWEHPSTGIQGAYGDNASVNGTLIYYPLDSNKDPQNNGEAWLFFIEFSSPSMDLKVYDKNGDPISFTTDVAYNSSFSDHFNIYVHADAPIGSILYRAPGNETIIVKTCAW